MLVGRGLVPRRVLVPNGRALPVGPGGLAADHSFLLGRRLVRRRLVVADRRARDAPRAAGPGRVGPTVIVGADLAAGTRACASDGARSGRAGRRGTSPRPTDVNGPPPRSQSSWGRVPCPPSSHSRRAGYKTRPGPRRPTCVNCRPLPIFPPSRCLGTNPSPNPRSQPLDVTRDTGYPTTWLMLQLSHYFRQWRSR